MLPNECHCNEENDSKGLCFHVDLAKSDNITAAKTFFQTSTTTTTTINTTSPCGNNDSRYKVIQNQCIYFETNIKNFENARENCKQKGGKLYEPKDSAKMKEIVKISQGNLFNFITLGNTWAWIGMTDIASEGNYVYDSNGLSINFTPLWYSGYGARGTSHNCISVLTTISSSNIGKFTDRSCLDTRKSICEL